MSLIDQIRETIQDVQNQLDELNQTKARTEDEILKKQEALDSIEEATRFASREIEKWVALLKSYDEELSARKTAAEQFFNAICDHDGDTHGLQNGFIEFMLTQGIELVPKNLEIEDIPDIPRVV